MKQQIQQFRSNTENPLKYKTVDSTLRELYQNSVKLKQLMAQNLLDWQFLKAWHIKTYKINRFYPVSKFKPKLPKCLVTPELT